MKIVGNTVGMGLPKPNLKQTDPRKGDFVKGKDEIPAKPEDIGAQPAGNYALKTEIPTKTSQLTNDSGYLTQHQDISGKLDASALPSAINTALAQAKASGEFDGKDGRIIAQPTAPEDTSVLWVDTSDDSNDGFQEAINIALTQAKASGEFNGADGKDGKDGRDGYTPVKGTDYFTAVDIAEMVTAVAAALPVYKGEVV